MVFVVDASIAAAGVLPSEDAAIADAALGRLGVSTTSSALWRARLIST